MTIEEQLLKLRLDKSMQQIEFAKTAGISVSSVSLYEQGKMEASNYTLSKINKAFGTDFEHKYPCRICEKMYAFQGKSRACPECVANGWKNKYKKPPAEKKIKKVKKDKPLSVIEINKIAQKNGMTYGQYIAMQYMKTRGA